MFFASAMILCPYVFLCVRAVTYILVSLAASLSNDIAEYRNKKCYEQMCINTFAGICNILDNVRNNIH